MLKDIGRLIIQRRPDGRILRCIIYIPVSVARDSQFPFNGNQNVDVHIEGKTIMIEKVKN